MGCRKIQIPQFGGDHTTKKNSVIYQDRYRQYDGDSKSNVFEYIKKLAALKHTRDFETMQQHGGYKYNKYNRYIYNGYDREMKTPLYMYSGYDEREASPHYGYEMGRENNGIHGYEFKKSQENEKRSNAYEYMGIEQHGGLKKGFRLQKRMNNKRNRYERTFTQVFADGSTEGEYTGFDYDKHPADGHYQLQGTAWLSAVKKAYRQACTDFRDLYRLSKIMEDYNMSNLAQADAKYKSLNKVEKLKYQEEAIKIQCEPMEIMLRETTPGNNKINFTYRQKKYYVISQPIKPKEISPSKGPTARIYRYIPKVYPMHLNETVEEFRKRKDL